jgi:hypothetical protein
MCVAAKDRAVVSAFPLPPPSPPLLLLCKNVWGNGNDNNFDGSGGSGGATIKDTGGNSGFVGGCAPLFILLGLHAEVLQNIG